MATNTELEKRLQALEEQNRILRSLIPGFAEETVTTDVTARKDYIEHGSKEYAAFVGLIEVQDDELEDAKQNKYVIYDSPETKKHWRLEDELGISQAFPTIDPDKAILMVLRQKVSTLEAGKPPIPVDAPPLLVPHNAF